MEELKLENAEFIENEDAPIDIRIRQRLDELQKIKEETIERLKIQQQLALAPIEAVIAELSAFLPLDEKLEEKPE